MTFASRDLALEALLYPFATGRLHWADRCLFLRARAGAGWPGTGVCEVVATQPFRPDARQLQQLGIPLLDEDALPEGAFPLVLALLPRQREDARALLARAVAAMAPGGVVVMAVANEEGAKSRQADLERLTGAVSSFGKSHCRVVWTAPGAQGDSTLLAQWQHDDLPRWQASAGVPGGGFWTRPGVFAWDRVDTASALLADVLPSNLAGRVADLGGGWGYLSLQVLARCPGVVSLELFEADARALALAERNLASLAQARGLPVHCHWQDVTAGVPGNFDAIVCNPPFHAQRRQECPDLGRAFIAAAAQALRPGGQLWLVANRHLPYEQALVRGFGRVEPVIQRDGFKVVRAVKA